MQIQFHNPEAILQAARVTLEANLAEVNSKLAELGKIRKEEKSQNGVTGITAQRTGIRQVADTSTPDRDPALAPRKKRTMTAAARKRIAAAQKKRWAAQKEAVAS